MQASNAPSKSAVPFANNGAKNTIPVASQIGITPGLASFTDGFPPLTMTPLAAGGVPPYGQDFNGILNFLSSGLRWNQSGGSYAYDVAFSAAIGGYPKGAILVNSAGTGFWLCGVDNNTTNPDSGGANWTPIITNLATTSVAGIVALASVAATQAGTSSTTAVTPAGLQEKLNSTLGETGGLVALLTASAASVTWTADEVIVMTSSGGQRYRIAGFSQTVSLGSTGIGGVIGSALTANGFAAIYAAYNPTTGTAGIFATNATASKAPAVATVAMPSGWTASALIGIAPVGASAGLFAPFAQSGRKVDWSGGNVLTGSSFIGGPIAREATSLIPLNARFISGFNQVGSTALSALSQTITPTLIPNAGGQNNTANVQAGASQAVPYRVAILVAQTLYQQTSSSAGTPSFTISINSYEF